MTTEEAQAVATRHFRAGNFQEAQAICQEILRAQPANAEWINFLGAIFLQQGDVRRAVPHFQQSIALEPNKPLFHCNLGSALNNLGRFHEARAVFQRALEMGPSCEAHGGLAAALSHLNELEMAETHFQAAVQIGPNVADAWNVGGNVAQLQGKWKEAAERFQRATELDPRHVGALNNLAICLHVLGRPHEAMAAYRRLLEFAQNFAEPHSNLAGLLQEAGDLARAEKHLREAIRIQPNFSDAHNNLGTVLQSQCRLDEAIACFRKAESLLPPDAIPNGNRLFCMNYHPRFDSATLLAEHRRWGERVENACTIRPSVIRDRCANRVLRIGYVSPDFREHAAAHFIEPFLRHHDPAQVEVICYAQLTTRDATTQRMQQAARGWRCTVGMSDAAMADVIRDDRIDILVDLAGHTSKSRLPAFAHKPAPVQVTYLGYPNTTGLTRIDYRLTDAIADPPGEAPAHTEELFRLPRSFCCYLPSSTVPEVGPLPAGRTGVVTFGSLHSLARLNRGVLDTWCALLRTVPASRLLVFHHTLCGKVRDELLRYLTSQGIHASRFDLRHVPPKAGGYPAVYHDVDVLLDTFPWSGHTTACQALWMGVPVITLRGDRFVGRMVASVLHHVGLPQFIAVTRERYVELATKLAGDVPVLARLRAELRQKTAASVLCDAAGFARNLERSYREMWSRFLRIEP